VPVLRFRIARSRGRLPLDRLPRRSTIDCLTGTIMTRTTLACCVLLCTFAAELTAQPAPGEQPDWRRSGVCYEVFVRSFHDSDGDGVGDLRGLIQKLDYINDGDPATADDLGANCIWLMPVAQSPSYHGYDVTNYYEINRDYGTNEDFRALMAEARRRGIHVIVDLVLNHMSSEHPIFKSALLDPASPYRDWFLWSPAPRPAPGWEAPVWHRAGARDEYYYGLFWGGMPDFNLANAEATAKLKDVARFWLEDMGVDGFRIDAVGHFFEGPSGEWKHDPRAHPWLRDYKAYVRSVKPDAFTIGEVWDNIDAIRPYYPDQLDNYFMFEVADGLINAVRSGAAAPLIDAVTKAQRELPRGRWSPFLRNHDQTRTMTELQGHVPRAKLAATLLLTLPGFPFLYYGEELGMTADKPDPRLRTPMHWTLERTAGFTQASLPWEPLQPDSFTANVSAQHGDPASLLNHHRRLIRLRAATPALGATGDFIPLETGRDGVVAYLRREGGQTVLVVANLGEAPVARLALSSSASVLPAGRYSGRPLLGRTRQAALRVGGDGRIRNWVAVPTLEPFEAYVLELVR
jgi:alpha-amylase